jgi:sugar phosphate isomerase/epimerase
MQPFSNLNDGSQNPPRLRVGHTYWNLEKLPFNAPVEWTVAEKIRNVKEAGFEHIECWIGDDENGRSVLAEVQRHGLHIALGHRPCSVDDTARTIEQAAKFGAQWVLCQPASAYHPLNEVVEIVREGARMAADKGICYFVETHRNNYTETIRQTLELIEAVPEIKMTADFSHFVVGGEFYGWEGEGAIERMMPIIEKVGHVHARISNGEQVQVDVGDGKTDPSARFFVQIWTEIFKNWRATAKPGDILPFSSELGPPRYSITTPDGKEISDRWAQSLVMRELALEAWQLSEA